MIRNTFDRLVGVPMKHAHAEITQLSAGMSVMSGKVDSVYSTVESGSAKWNSTFATVLANSAEWSISGGVSGNFLTRAEFTSYTGSIDADMTAISAEVYGLSAAIDNNTNAHSAFITRGQFNAYSGQVDIYQHSQDLSITGKVSTDTYVAGQHVQDLAITGRLERSVFESYSGQMYIDQHSQDLVITGKVSTDTYVAGQHEQDLSITGVAAAAANALSAYVTLGTSQTVSGQKIFSAPATFESNVRIEGVLTALSSVFIVSEIIDISANYITLNSNVTGTPVENAGLNVNRGLSAASQLLWNEDIDRWQAGISGQLQNIVLSGDLDQIYARITDVENATSAFLTHAQFDIYSGDVAGQLTVLSGMATPHYGSTASRPAGVGVGYMYFDTDLSYPIWWNGAKWVNATGAEVD